MSRTEIRREDVLPMEEYQRVRRAKRREISALKKDRRLEVGPFATFYFENYDTMWSQVHEMLAIGRGGEEQIPDALHAYNPLIPKGRELVATVMFEIDDPVRRKAVLSKLGGVEETMFLTVGGEKIRARAEQDVDRTTADGKASSVQFVHFDFTPDQIAAFRRPETQVLVGIEHPGYGHIAVMPDRVRAALARDFA